MEVGRGLWPWAPWSTDVGIWWGPRIRQGSGACANNRELCKENHIEIGAVTTKAKNTFYGVPKERTSGCRNFVGAGREAP